MNLNTEPFPAVRAIGDLETLRVIVDSRRPRALHFAVVISAPSSAYGA